MQRETPALPPLVEAMRDPGFYPHRPASVEFHQTHISYVFLAGDRVYKVKKPVRFRFLDFSTLELRRHYCREEVRLNRRLAPDVYLGVVGLRGSGSEYQLTAEDDPQAVELAVHMRRLPADRFLATLLERGLVTVDMIDALSDRLVSFHERATTSPAIAAYGEPGAIARVIGDSFATARPFRGKSLAAADDEAIQTFCHSFLGRHRALLEARAAKGRIRECHGDLHAEHVCFADPLVIYDCVEFSESLRCCDVASEIAFLAMDLEFHERPDLSERLVSRYADLACDRDLPAFVPFYACHRAYIRGLVDGLAADEPEVKEGERAELRASAAQHFELAYRYTWAYCRCLVVVTGLSGSGKSSLARALERRTGFRRWSSDRVRKALAGLAPLERVPPSRLEWLYSPQLSARTYAALYAEAERALASGSGVILDATFLRRIDRDRAREAAARTGAAVVFVECRSDEEEIRRRLTRRDARGDDPSDADWDVFLRQQVSYEAIGPDEQDVLTIDTTRGIDLCLAPIEQKLRERTQTDEGTAISV